MGLDRQKQKEILRMRREIELVVTQIEKNSQAAGAKESENKQIADAITEQEKENDRLESRIGELEGEVVELDEEFKENQIAATRLRKETQREEEALAVLQFIQKGERTQHLDTVIDRLGKDHPLVQEAKGEPLDKKLDRVRNQQNDLDNKLRDLRKLREGSEYKLRKTIAKIEDIQKHPLSKPITARIEKAAKKVQKERDEKGVVEKTMEQRLREIDAIVVPSVHDFLETVLAERGQAGTAATNGSADGEKAKPKDTPKAATAAAGGDAAGTELDLSL